MIACPSLANLEAVFPFWRPSDARNGSGHLSGALAAQGTESGLMGDDAEDGGEVSRLPACALSAKPEASLVLDGSQEIYDDVSDDGHISGAMTLSQT